MTTDYWQHEGEAFHKRLAECTTVAAVDALEVDMLLRVNGAIGIQPFIKEKCAERRAELRNFVTPAMVKAQVLQIAARQPLLEHVKKIHRPLVLTRHQKVRRWLLDWRERLSTAWRVLRGDDIHGDCD